MVSTSIKGLSAILTIATQLENFCLSIADAFVLSLLDHMHVMDLWMFELNTEIQLALWHLVCLHCNVYVHYSQCIANVIWVFSSVLFIYFFLPTGFFLSTQVFPDSCRPSRDLSNCCDYIAILGVYV